MTLYMKWIWQMPRKEFDIVMEFVNEIQHHSVYIFIYILYMGKIK